MKGSTFKVCTTCPKRKSWSGPEQQCPACGSSEFTWSFKVTLGKKPDGRPNQVKRGGFERKADAEDELRRLLEEHSQGRHVDRSRMTVAEFLDEWLEARRLKVSPSTLANNQDTVRQYLAPRLGTVPLQELTPPQVNAAYADLRDNGRTRGEGPLSASTIRKAHTVLHKALNDAKRWGYVATNAATDADPPTATAVKNARKKAIQVWTVEQIQTFAGWLLDHRPELYALWLLAISTGLRRSELLGLRWEDVDLDRGRLAVRQVLIKVDGGMRFKEAPKSQHGYRTIRFSARIADVLRVHRTSQTKDRLESPFPWADHDLVFCRPDPTTTGEPAGGPWHPDTITHRLGEAIDASGLPRIRPLQDMRHSHATVLLLEGEHMKVVQERLGHHSFAFTADTYTHLAAGMDEAAADRFDAAVFDGDDESHQVGL